MARAAPFAAAVLALGKVLALGALLAALPAAPAGAQADAQAGARERSARVVYKPEPPARREGALPYLLYLPPGYDDASRRWPLLVVLHGTRGSGIDPGKLSRYPIPRLIESGGHEVPFVVLVPQAPPGKVWTEVDGLMALIDEIASARRVDPERVYLTGQSMGAEGVWHAAYTHPGQFAAIAPMFGAADPAWAERLATTPTWVFHGALDTVVPVGESDRMVAELERHGASVRYTRHDDRYHEPPTDAELIELLDWLLEHRLAGAD